jgi:eukaryotic-like serine/threonine-protein kinase
MSLQAGTRLGPYEVISLIGSGGMGEVYKARDARLNRDVAIKVLPALFARDPDRMARLEQEARAAAALNAPGIVAVFDIGTYEGAPFIVSELLEGESLRARLDQGPVPPRKAAEYAAQIASALAAAHARGIVHRDLKPENLFLTRDGRMKILDFGLAKAAVPSGVGSLATGFADTSAGTVMGTVGYMAPEQVRGEAADARSDIFSLGATLYEMLTGQRAFSRGSAVETMNAILREEPPDISPEMTTAIPGALQAILSRCLEKRPDDRFHSAHDLALSLQAAGAGRATSSSVERVVPKPPARVLPWLLAILALAIVAVAAIAVFVPRRVARLPSVASLKQLTELPGAEINPDISPDGRQVLYAAGPAGASDLFLLRVGGGRAINLTASSSTNDAQGAFSPDGEQIAFRSERDGGGIFVMGATGESAKRITTAGFDPRWAPDGKFLAYATEAVRDPYSRSVVSELWTVEIATGTTKQLLAGDAVQPTWSPHGTRIAFWANTGGQRDIATVAVSGGQPVPVTRDPATDWAPEWSPDGKWLYFVSDRGGAPNLWRVAIDQDTGATAGEPESITNGTRAIASARFSRDGSRMVIGATDRAFELGLYAFDPAQPGRATLRSTIRSASLGWCAPSPDGAWLACTARSGQEDIVLLRSDGSESRRLIDDPFKDRIPTWSPDGRTLVFMSTRSGNWELWSIGADGSGLRQLTALKTNIGWGAWAPDGRHLAVTSVFEKHGGWWMIDPSKAAGTAGAATHYPADSRVGVDTWSSDGTLLAGGMADAAGDPQAIGVWDARAGTFLKRIDVPLMRVTSLDASFVPGTHELLAHTPDGIALVNADTGHSRVILKMTPPFNCRISGDGRTLLVERPGIEADLWLMEFRK